MNRSIITQNSDTPFADQLLGAIVSVHDVSGFGRLTIERKPLPPGWTGKFDPYTRTVTVSPEAPYPLSTGAHEVGHAVDAIFLVTASRLGRLDGPITLYASQYAADGRGVLVEWLKKVSRSGPIVALFNLARLFPFMSENWEKAQEFLLPTEMWARAYEQFVSERTQDPSLKAQFAAKRLQQMEIGDRKIRVYWTQEEFQPIEHEIERVLQSLGWI